MTDGHGRVTSLSQTTGRLHDGIDRGEEVMRSLTDISAAVEQTSAGVSEVAKATDDQAVSAEQIAEIVDRANDLAVEVSDKIGDIADANRSQTEQVLTIRDAAHKLGTGVGSDADETSPSSSVEVPESVDGPPAGVLTDASFDTPPDSRLSNDGGTTE